MQDHERLTAAECELERALSAHVPAASGIDRDRLMFRAGRAAGRRNRWLWRGATAAATVVLAASLIVRPQPRQVERIVFVPVESAPGVSVADPQPETDPDRWAEHARYAAIREELLAGNPDALPLPVYAGQPTQRPPTLRDLLGVKRPPPPASPLARLGSFLFGGKS